MKVALVFPEIYDIARFYGKRKEFPPFGVLYLAAVLEEIGLKVDIISVGSEDKSLDMRAFDVVAFSIPSSVTYHIIKTVRDNSIFSDHALLIAGGVHATIYPQETLLDLSVPVLGIGPGEETIVEIINQFDSRDFSKVKGVCYRKGDLILFTDTRQLTRGLDHLPIMPARHLMPISDNIMSNRLSNTSLRMTHVMLTKGCPYSCHFCASQQRQMQYRSGWHVQRELIALIKQYGIEGFAVVGDNFLVNREKTLDICNAIANLDLRWSTLSRVDTVEYGILETMCDAGCIEVKFGIESGSETMLEAMGKNISVAQIRNALKITHSLGIKVKIFLIHGYPGENMKTTEETIRLLEELRPIIDRVSLFRFVPLPGSHVYKHAGTNRLLIANDHTDWARSHIHHNSHHWWGSDEDFSELSRSYEKLDQFVSDHWG